MLESVRYFLQNPYDRTQSTLAMLLHYLRAFLRTFIGRLSPHWLQITFFIKILSLSSCSTIH